MFAICCAEDESSVTVVVNAGNTLSHANLSGSDQNFVCVCELGGGGGLIAL